MRSGRTLLMMLASLAVFLGARAAVGPFGDKPESPRSLPADNLPPFRMLDSNGHLPPLPPPPPGGLHHGGPESTAAGPSLAQAMKAAQAAIETCGAAGFRVGVSVIDSAGEIRAAASADGADGSHVFVATRKALTALEFKMPSGQAADAIERDNALLARVKPNMFVMRGAVPIVRQGATIGAIGVSGAGAVPFGRQDEECAQAGVKVMEMAR